MKYAIAVLIVLSLCAVVLSKVGPMKKRISDAPQTASYQFSVPAAIMNPDMRGNPWSQIRLYVDGTPQREFRGQAAAGRHTIVVVTGALRFEQVFNFESGKTYTLEVFGGITLK